jgi:hypothetical protein
VERERTAATTGRCGEALHQEESSPDKKEVQRLAEAAQVESVTAEKLGLRDLPRGWRGAPLNQLVASARKIVEQSEATGGSGDPRLRAALKVLEYDERLKAEST